MTRSLLMSSPPSSQQTQSAPLPVPKRSLMPSSHLKKQKFSDSLENQSDCSQAGSPDCIYDEEEPRVITMHTKKSTNLGISLLGGNAVGIYVHDVQKNSLADVAGLKKGDHVSAYCRYKMERNKTNVYHLYRFWNIMVLTYVVLQLNRLLMKYRQNLLTKLQSLFNTI